ncbi:MAG: MFS transporter [Lachnospiraceae bacterium]|nr:MFS transporter [Lachnospiraceae bacterium]
MATVLIAVIYAAFIGLGLPDSLFGTAWPSIYREFGLPIAFGSLESAICFLGTILSSLLSARLIRRFGTARLTAGCTLLTAVSLVGYGWAGSFPVMLALAVPLGLGAGSVDTALNNYVALHYSASRMSFLHCFYGVGVTVSPFILAMVFRNGMNWRAGYRAAAGIQLALAAALFLSVPIWRKVHGGEKVSEENFQTLTLREAASINGVKIMWLLFACTCAIEMSVGSWSSTYLVEHLGRSQEFAARSMTVYYLGMTAGRFFSGILARKLHSWQIVKLGLCVMGAALLLLLLTESGIVVMVALAAIGLGNGPMFPNFNYVTPENFGEEKSPAIIGTQMVAANVSIVTLPVLCGICGQALGMWIFPYYLLACFAVMLIVFAAAMRTFSMPRLFGRRGTHNQEVTDGQTIESIDD